jgi:RND family efflux transporter MFP subunit
MKGVAMLRTEIPTSWICLLSLLMLDTGCQKEAPPDKPALRPVRSITIDSKVVGRQRTFSGTAHAGLESRMSFKVAGTIKRIAVKVGGQVKQGDLLAEIDDKDYVLQVEQARASLAQAKAQSRNTKAAFERTRELFANRTVAKSEFDAARAAADSAEALVRASSKQVQLLSQQKRYTRLTAPIAGSISAIKAESNENVAAGQVVVVLTSGKDIEVKVNVPELVIAKVKKGQSVSVKFAALKGREFHATVEEVGVSSIATGATYPVTVRLAKPDEAIRAGMAAEVVFNFEQAGQRGRILVPPEAVGQDHRGRFVFVVIPGDESGAGVVKRRNVEVGELTGQGLEITTGLVDGDQLVTAGLSFLEDGRRVKMPISSK